MKYARNNIIVNIRDSKPSEYAIFNLLSGSFDLMTAADFQKLQEFLDTKKTDQFGAETLKYLLERGYLYDSTAEEDELIRKRFAGFQAEIEDSQVQLLLIPSYGCNLACTYCYEHGLPEKSRLITKETMDAFFEYARSHFGDRQVKPFVTLFGGEPLIDSPAQRGIIQTIVERCAQEGYEIAAVTNGYDLASYVDILALAKVKEIQITLDGSREVHDGRRATANGRGTFDRIVDGLAKAIKRGLPINLRTVVDRENLADLVNLASFLDERGWLDLGREKFQTQIGRNYELFDCYAKPQHLMAQAELWADIVKMSKANPILKKFYRPDFKGLRHLVDTGSLPMASFDTCPAAKTEWVFDLHGDIYGCTASCGREEYKLGTYYPETTLNERAIGKWQARNVLNIPECATCQYNVICGGGCGVVAANRTGEILSPDCRPIQEIVDQGVQYYNEEIHAMAGEELIPAPGCLVCGADLVYSREPAEADCAWCGKQVATNTLCSEGHYICDDCHRGDILGLVEQICIYTELSDPVALAQAIFELPGLNMHGPEYHSIVPAVIVAAYGNAMSTKDISVIKTAIERGKAVKGGFCGLYGACGAGIGLGIAYSILHNVSPLSGKPRGDAQRWTAEALTAIGRHDGPRCCKRETVTALQLARGMWPLEEQIIDGSNYTCAQFAHNKDCLGSGCPFFPSGQSQKAVSIENLERGCCC